MKKQEAETEPKPVLCKYCGTPIYWIYDPVIKKRRPMEGLKYHKCGDRWKKFNDVPLWQV